MKAKLTAAAKRWAKMPAETRELVISYFQTEVEQSAAWARDPTGTGLPVSEHRRDARGFRAAVALLRAAQRQAS